VLESLKIISTIQPQPRVNAYALSPVFARSLRQALTGGGNHRSFGVPCTVPDGKKQSIADLDEWARSQWEAILYYIVGSSASGLMGGSQITKGTKAVLEYGNYVESSEKSGRITVTQAGFTFLLQEVNAQVWSLLIVYLNNAPLYNMDPVDVLSFLFMLGSLELGQAYSTANLTATQNQLLEDLTDFGIIYHAKEAPYYYPTRLATTLTSDASGLSNDADGMPSSLTNTLRSSPQGRGYIIIETNYRIYAYTSSVLQIAVLNLFAKLKTRYPNLVAGKLTKESIQRAISYGITADQIISYLTTHAHPQMQKNVPVLPPTVVDQIRLWQIEGDRMKATPGHLLKEFGSQQEYEDVVNYAESLGVIVWRSDSKRMFFVNNIEQVKLYLVSRRKPAGPSGSGGNSANASANHTPQR
jgi:transcription initiation factor TFIIH subunit 4